MWLIGVTRCSNTSPPRQALWLLGESSMVSDRLPVARPLVSGRRSYHGYLLTTLMQISLRELRRRNRLLKQENEVLRREAAFLPQANLPGNGSTCS